MSASNESKDSSSLSPDNHYISDTIKVVVVPEKRGTFLKHTEYQITSLKWENTVDRRYNDFVSLHNFLILKFANRIIPRLPPKQLMIDSMIEERRLGLQRWLRLISNHPIMCRDELFRTFMTDKTNSYQENIRLVYEKNCDEFLNINSMSLPYGDEDRLVGSREFIRVMLNLVLKFKRLMDQQVKREQDQSMDFGEMSLVLNSIIKESNDNSLIDFELGFKKLSKVSEVYAENKQEAIFERLNMLIDILIAHSDMCDRIEKNISNNHQSLSKMLSARKLKITDVVRVSNVENDKAIEERQQNEIEMMGKRNSFGVYCAIEETKFAQKYIKLLPSILLQFSHEASEGSTIICEAWAEVIIAESRKLDKFFL